MDRKETSHEVTQQEFIEGVLSGGKRRDAMLELAITATPAPGARASDNRQLGQFVSDVLSILRSPINPFEGMLEAPSPIVRLYQTHRESMSERVPIEMMPCCRCSGTHSLPSMTASSPSPGRPSKPSAYPEVPCRSMRQ